MLFVLLHETAHALVSEMGLPVLGREEDAADAYATVTMPHGMSMEKLAAQAGLDRAWMGRMEAGRENATPSQLEKLARAFHMQSAELIALPRSVDMPVPAPGVRRLKRR
jgi:hypothetical protein